MAVIRPSRHRQEKQILVLGAPVSYSAPLNEIHTEYPKHVHLSPLISVVVNNPAEEEAAHNGAELAKPQPKQRVSDAPIPFLQGGDEREMLMTIANKRGVRVDMRWPTTKIRRVLNKAFPAPQVEEF